MEKQKYYIAVGSGEISADQHAVTYEYEVEATPEEIRELRSLFMKVKDNEWSNFQRATIPQIPYHNDEENDQYEDLLSRIYQKIYEYATPVSKEHLESTGMINREGIVDPFKREQ